MRKDSGRTSATPTRSGASVPCSAPYAMLDSARLLVARRMDIEPLVRIPLPVCQEPRCALSARNLTSVRVSRATRSVFFFSFSFALSTVSFHSARFSSSFDPRRGRKPRVLFSTPPNEGRKDQEGGTAASTRSTENLKIGKQLLPPLAISVTLVLLPATVGGTDKKEAKFVVGDHVRRDHVLGADLSLSPSSLSLSPFVLLSLSTSEVSRHCNKATR